MTDSSNFATFDYGDGIVDHFEIIGDELVSLPDHNAFTDKLNILNARFGEVPPRAFYRYLFPEGTLERLGHQEDHKPNGLILEIVSNKEGRNTGRHTILTDGLEQLDDALRKECVICSPISYYGRSRKASNALYMHALTLDIDYVGLTEMRHLIHWIEQEVIPRPTFIANSGHGVHLYFVFEEPIPMFKENQKELRKLKAQLVKQIWTDYTSTKVENIETLGVVQGFRMVGSRTKLFSYNVTAHQSGDRVTLDYLNSFVMPEHRACVAEKHGLTLSEARNKYPEWYQRVVVEGRKPGRWHVKRDLYDWYKKRIETETTFGHRYFCLMCLAIYAAKCDIPYSELEEDALHFQVKFNAIKPDHPFTVDEAFKALEAYNEDYVTFPRDSIARVTALPMTASKRNGRNLTAHQAYRRGIKQLKTSLGEDTWNKGGRPSKESQIKAYAAEHPEANRSQIARDLGISRQTVIKWLKDADV